jgi:hypothetical protein
MRKKIPYSVFVSERETAALVSEFVHDHKDVYFHQGGYRNEMTREIVVEYEIVKVNCDPDFDW